MNFSKLLINQTRNSEESGNKVSIFVC